MFRPQTNLIVQNASGEPVKFEIGYGKTHYSSDEKEIAFSNTYQSNNNPPYMHYYGQYHEFDGNIIPYGSDDYIGTSGNK